MDDHTHEYVGTVYVLPQSRSFELSTTIHGVPATVTGTIAQHLAEQLVDHTPDWLDPRQLALRPRRVEVLTRETHERHRAPRKQHFLMRVHEVEEQARPVPMSTT